MERQKSAKKHVCVTLTPQEHERLVHMANCSYRTAAGYLHWLLLRHFREQEQETP